MTTNVSVIIPAAGLSLRMKSEKRKPYIVIGEKPIILHTLEKFSQLEIIKEIILVVNKDDVSSVIEKWSGILKSYKVTKIIAGGRRRQDSVYEGLCQVDPDSGIVLIHDAVRPMISRKIIEDVIKEVQKYGAAIVAAPMNSTVKKTDQNLNIIETVPRHDLWIAQTPQGFKRDIIIKAYEKIKNTDTEFTDDAAVVENEGYPIKIVTGSDDNIKITTREDLQLAESLLVSR